MLCLRSVEMYFPGTQAVIYLQAKVLLQHLLPVRKKEREAV